MVASCGGDDDGTNSDPTPTVAIDTTSAVPTPTAATGDGSTTPDSSVGSTSADEEAAAGVLPDACDVIDLEDWEAITALDLTVPEQDTESFSVGGTVCGVAVEGTEFPILFTVAIDPTDSPGSVENLVALLGDYNGMEQVDGIGDRALYWNQDTTYQGGAIADHPVLAFEDGPANVTITLRVDSLGRAELEQLAMTVAEQL